MEHGKVKRDKIAGEALWDGWGRDRVIRRVDWAVVCLVPWSSDKLLYVESFLYTCEGLGPGWRGGATAPST